MSTELQDITVDFEHQENVTIAKFVIQEISFLNNVDEVQCQFREEIEAHRPNRLIIDFERVTYISTAGVRMLLSILMHVRRFGGKVLLCNVSEIIRAVLELSHLTNIFKIFPDRQAAVAD